MTQALDLNAVKTCKECGKVYTPKLPTEFCGDCTTASQVRLIHHIMQYHRWKVLPVDPTGTVYALARQHG